MKAASRKFVSLANASNVSVGPRARRARREGEGEAEIDRRPRHRVAAEGGAQRVDVHALVARDFIGVVGDSLGCEIEPDARR